MIPLGVFLLGLIIGSFLNVCILRIPADQSIVLPASSCTKCGQAIAPYDNIPVVSWLALGGKCRNCKTKISAMYPAVELLTGLLFLACYLRFGLTVDALKWALFAALLVVLTITDLRERILPDEVNFFGLGAGLLLSFFTSPIDGTALWIANRCFEFPPPRAALSFADAALGAAVGSGLLWAVAEGYFRLRGREGMGLGRRKDDGRGWRVSGHEAHAADDPGRVAAGKRDRYRFDCNIEKGERLRTAFWYISGGGSAAGCFLWDSCTPLVPVTPGGEVGCEDWNASRDARAKLRTALAAIRHSVRCPSDGRVFSFFHGAARVPVAK